MKSSLEKEAREVLQSLIQHGYEAYFVGGYVRDTLASKPIKDIDIATSATPDQVMHVFPRTAPTGLQHGTVTVIMEHHVFEVTTFRAESEYEQFRRPVQVEFITNLEEDLKRRDFTINAMAVDIHNQLIDPFNGAFDLQQKILRCVGNPYERFREDALRMMRCLRFACEYELEIESNTWHALLESASLMQHIAMERIHAEMERMIEGRFPDRALSLLVQSRLFHYYKQRIDLPWLTWVETPHDVKEGMLSIANDAIARWVFLFAYMRVASDQVVRSMQLLKFPRVKIKAVSQTISLLYWLEHAVEPSCGTAANLNLNVRQYFLCGILRFGKDAAESLCRLPDTLSPILPMIRQSGPSWIEELSVYHIHDLQVSGRELIQRLGKKPGPWLGELLDKLLVEVALGRLHNTKDALLEQAKIEMES